MPTPAARGRLRGLLDRRVVVEDVLQPRVRHELHEVGPDHRLHVEVGARAELVERLARDGVAGQHRAPAVVLDPVADRRVDGSVVGLAHPTVAPATVNESPGATSVTSSSGGCVRSSWWSRRYCWSGPSIASSASITAWVPGGP